MEPLPELIEDGDLVLRRWRPADAEAQEAAVLANLEHLKPWMPWAAAEPQGPTARRGMLSRWEREWSEGGDVHLAVLAEGEVAGGGGLHWRRGPRALEIGYWIAAARTGRGLGTRVAALLTDAAFAIPRIERVEVHHDRANRASAAIPRKLGFTLYAETPDSIEAPAEEGVDCGWAIEREEWLRRG
ncbi:MAG: GNAT family protein [Solirubrobacterales bacterium]